MCVPSLVLYARRLDGVQLKLSSCCNHAFERRVKILACMILASESPFRLARRAARCKKKIDYLENEEEYVGMRGRDGSAGTGVREDPAVLLVAEEAQV